MKIGDKVCYGDVVYTIKEIRRRFKGIQTCWFPSKWVDGVVLEERKGVWPITWFTMR